MECEVCNHDTMELVNKVNDNIGEVEKNYKCSYCHSELTWSYGHWELQKGINFQKENKMKKEEFIKQYEEIKKEDDEWNGDKDCCTHEDAFYHYENLFVSLDSLVSQYIKGEK